MRLLRVSLIFSCQTFSNPFACCQLGTQGQPFTIPALCWVVGISTPMFPDPPKLCYSHGSYPRRSQSNLPSYILQKFSLIDILSTHHDEWGKPIFNYVLHFIEYIRIELSSFLLDIKIMSLEQDWTGTFLLHAKIGKMVLCWYHGWRLIKCFQWLIIYACLMVLLCYPQPVTPILWSSLDLFFSIAGEEKKGKGRTYAHDQILFYTRKNSLLLIRPCGN